MVSATGSYRLRTADGQTHSFEVPELPAPLEITGPWQVHFPADMDVPEQTTIAQLMSWTDHPNETIKYFSGTATYMRTFDLPADRLGAGQIVLLDLGRVEAMAEVRLNGKHLGTFWKPPFVVDIAGAVRPGANALEVKVSNVWLNRLIGDQKYPNGFPGEDHLQFKPHLAADVGIRADNRPVPSGLIGPVRILTTLEIQVP